jgi:hypothetical protein
MLEDFFMDYLEFEVGEEELAETHGDYWQKFLLLFYMQKSGKIHITNRRIIFSGGLITNLELEIKNIAAVEKCWVGPVFSILPTGIKVTMCDARVYKFSVLFRCKYIKIINEIRQGS